MSEAIYVIPCYNEEHRLQVDEVLALARRPGMRILLVDDGSRDGTRSKLEGICRGSADRASWISLERQSGKAEAVRQGMLHAMSAFPLADFVGYLDADLSTPIREAERLVTEARTSGASVILGARVALLGRNIVRSPGRHLLGRIFASGASAAVGLRVYDTQCGAKLFRVNATLKAALASRFLSRWAFDVELLGRLLNGTSEVSGMQEREFLEVPLLEWSDVPGSKLRLRHMARSAFDLIRIARVIARDRKLRSRNALVPFPVEDPRTSSVARSPRKLGQ